MSQKSGPTAQSPAGYHEPPDASKFRRPVFNRRCRKAAGDDAKAWFVLECLLLAFGERPARDAIRSPVPGR